MLRPYQITAVEGLRDSLRAKHKRILLTVPTGGGKTLIATEVVRSGVAKQRRVLFVAHRRELIEQASSKLTAAGIRHGVILSERDASPLERVQVASIQTLESRVFRRKSADLPPADIVIFDEAHHAVSPTWLKVANSYPNATILGLTATPVRGDGKGLGHLFTDMVLGPSIPELTAAGYLVPVRYYAPSLPDLYGLKILAGDYNQKQLDERMNRPKLVGDVVSNWGEVAGDRKTVVFASSVDHSLHLAQEFQREGVAAEHLDGETPLEQRETILRDLAEGRLQVVCNVGVLTEGWDLPSVSCCVLARPTKSLGLYLQCAGRVLRPAPGKENTVLLDHAGAIREHGRIDAPFEWSLDAKEKITVRERTRREKQPARSMTCERCKAVYEGQRLCPECGHTPTRYGEARAQLEATLQETAGGKTRSRRKEYAETDRRTWYVMLRYYQQTKGKKPAWVDYTFREKFGVTPPPEWAALAPVYPSLEVSRYIRSRQIAYAMRMKPKQPKAPGPLFGGAHD